MAILGLGYIGIGVSDIEAWRRFAQDVLGVGVTDGPDGGLKLRMDSRDWRIWVEPTGEDDIVYAGWEVSGPQALAIVAAKLTAAGHEVTRDDGSLAARRGCLELARFTDPAGVIGELFWGATDRPQQPFRSPTGVSRFITGDQGLGHIVVQAQDPRAVGEFYQGLLEFRLSDQLDMTVAPGKTMPVTFMHCNSRHHSYAFAPARPGGTKKLHHFMIETGALDDVGFALDRCAEQRVPMTMTLGRHTNDEMVSFYAQTPSGFHFEYGWGAITIDDLTWTPVRLDSGDVWGHKFVGQPH